MKWKKNKKGMIIEIILIFIVVVVFAIAILVNKHIFLAYNEAIQEQDNSTILPAAKTATNDMLSYYDTVDNMFLFILISLCIAVCVFSFFVRTHPIFLVFNILLIAFLIFLTMVFSNIYESIATTDAFAATNATMTAIPFIMTKLPYFAVVFSLIIMGVMYAKPSEI